MPAPALLRQIPSVDKLINHAALADVREQFGHSRTKSALHDLLDGLRQQVSDGLIEQLPDAAQLAGSLTRHLSAADQPSLKPVFNLTGTVLHTNLGRAMLPDFALDAVSQVAGGASNLEFDLASGQRGDRDSHLESLITELTGAEAATVVNNNAAAVMLCLNTLALDKKALDKKALGKKALDKKALGRNVCVSRGELVEIGGSFRIPDIMARSGCELREVGTTNRTHLKDYADAIDPSTAALMKVHTSNYAIQGFTAEVSWAALASLAHERDLPCLVDLGSGNLIDLTVFGLAREPTVSEVLQEGPDLVTFSGDKLLGGPQAGIIAGRADLIAQVKRNPLKRALRVGKMTIAALAAVLQAYRSPESLAKRIPSLGQLARTADEINLMAEAVLPAIKQFLPEGAKAEIVDCESQIGSGALPLNTLPSRGIRISPAQSSEAALQALASRFRELTVPVLCRLQDGCLLLDLRTLDAPEQFSQMLTAQSAKPTGGAG